MLFVAETPSSCTTVLNVMQDLPKPDELPSKPAEDESKTIYKVIDKDKTYAFKKTKEDRENQRHANDP